METTEQTEDFKPSKITIKVKLIGIISAIIIFALSLMIFLASAFFRNDNEKRIQENTLKLTEVIGQRVESELSSVFHNLRINALVLESGGQKDTILRLFFENYPNIFYFGVGVRSAEGIRPLTAIFNDKFINSTSITKDDILNLHKVHSINLQPAFSGATVMINASPGFQVPAYAIAIPLKKGEQTTVLFAYSASTALLQAFSNSGITTTYMVGPTGAVIAHPDEKLVLSNADISSSPIVQALLQSRIDNGQIRFTDSDSVVRLASFKKMPVAGLGIISTVPEEKAMEEVYNIQRRNILILFIILGTAVLVVFFYSRSLTTPVVKLVDATKQIEAGDFQIEVKPASGDEIGILTNSFIKMGAGLEEREKVKQILGSMIDPTVVQEAMKDLAALKRGAERQITAFFSDVAGFSAISEKLTSVDLASVLNEYLSAMTLILKEHDGVLDKYIGDAIVGIWNAPIDVENHTMKAAEASVKMIARLAELREYWKSNNMYIKEAQEMDVRIGLNYGPAKTGFMGTDALASYTMMGDTVNLAARLEAAAKDYGVNILVADSVHEQIGNQLLLRKLDKVRVKGKNEPVTLYELIGKADDFAQGRVDAVHEFELGISAYFKKDFSSAIKILEKIDTIRGEKDKAAHMLIERCQTYLLEPPPENWDGVFTRTHK